MSSITQINKAYVQLVHDGDPVATRQFKICFVTKTPETSSGNPIYVKAPIISDVNNARAVLVELTTNSGQADQNIPVITSGGHKYHFQFIEYHSRASLDTATVIIKDLSSVQRKTKVQYDDAETASEG